MIIRFLILAMACLGGSPLLAESEGDVAGDPLEAIRGIPFEEIEASWEGRPRDWVLRVEGRLPGVVKPVHYEHRMKMGDEGWESEGRLSLPATRVEDFSRLLARFPELDELSGGGTVAVFATVAGRGEGLRWNGRLVLDDVSLEHEEKGLSIQGLSGVLDWAVVNGEFTTAPDQVLRVESLSWQEVEASGLEFEFEIASGSEWQVGPMEVSWAGGRISAGEMTFNPARPDVTVRLVAEGIQLAELLRLAPELEGRGEGILDGEFGLRISPEGIGLEPGHLALRPGAPASLRIPQRAWLTEGMSPEAPNYENLRIVERALENLQLTAFRFEVLSEDAEDVPLKVVIEGKPLEEDLGAPAVSLTLQVHGPVEQIANWLWSPGVRIGVE